MITLSEGQKLSAALPKIPANCILSKRIPGCGATTLELRAKRNSIIIVPNVPVIVSKCGKFPNLLGVYENVTIDKIAEYLSKNRRYKIMTTPESFSKVKAACEKCQLDMHKKFFLLMDECHQLIKDVDYRIDIVMPMSDFFRFKRKALVSATPLGFSDPRFKKFKTIEVSADYDYQQAITVTHTNNIAKAVSLYLENHQDGTICFFLNSVTEIYSIMKQFNLLNESTVYCAPKSCFKLKSEYGFSNAYHEWSAQTMKRYNFFTGRFYTAFDLELTYKPDLVMITDPQTSPHTMLDVDTDCIQICGRFRKGINSATHIYKVDSHITVKTREQLEQEISAHESVYQTIQTLYNTADSREHRYAFGEALETLPFRKYLYPNFTKNYFAIDNAINEGLVNGHYKTSQSIMDWYVNCHYFIPSFDECKCSNWDEKLRIVAAARSVKDKRRKMVQLLSEFEPPYSENALDFINDIRKIDPFIVEAYEVLGKEWIEELEYCQRKIKEEMILVQRKGCKVLRLIKNSFTVGQTYTNAFITKELARIFDRVHIHPEKPIKGSMIKDYFQTEDWRSNKNRGYRLISAII